MPLNLLFICATSLTLHVASCEMRRRAMAALASGSMVDFDILATRRVSVTHGLIILSLTRESRSCKFPYAHTHTERHMDLNFVKQCREL